jgi:hypothetical protein
MNKVFQVFIFSFFFLACHSDKDDSDIVARAFGNTLLKKEILKNIPYGSSTTDSVEIAHDYIEQWLRKQIVLRKAELNLDEEQKEVSQQLEDYKTSLLIFAYEQELIRQKLDTLVSEKEIEDYYKSNQANFELKNNIIRLRYVKLPIKAPNIEKVKSWLQKGDLNKLEQYCSTYAVNYLLSDDTWLLLDDVLKEIPLADYNAEQFSRNIRVLERKDTEYLYLIHISGFMVKESNAPLSFEKNNIRNIILNKRKIMLIQQMQEEAYQEALNSKDAEIYDK